ncbi:hypothetical protein J437_LFUL003694, partial [Ladona fulva]
VSVTFGNVQPRHASEGDCTQPFTLCGSLFGETYATGDAGDKSYLLEGSKRVPVVWDVVGKVRARWSSKEGGEAGRAHSGKSGRIMGRRGRKMARQWLVTIHSVITVRSLHVAGRLPIPTKFMSSETMGEKDPARIGYFVSDLKFLSLTFRRGRGVMAWKGRVTEEVANDEKHQNSLSASSICLLIGGERRGACVDYESSKSVTSSGIVLKEAPAAQKEEAPSGSGKGEHTQRHPLPPRTFPEASGIRLLRSPRFPHPPSPSCQPPEASQPVSGRDSPASRPPPSGPAMGLQRTQERPSASSTSRFPSNLPPSVRDVHTTVIPARHRIKKQRRE